MTKEESTAAHYFNNWCELYAEDLQVKKYHSIANPGLHYKMTCNSDFATTETYAHRRAYLLARAVFNYDKKVRKVTIVCHANRDVWKRGRHYYQKRKYTYTAKRYRLDKFKREYNPNDEQPLRKLAPIFTRWFGKSRKVCTLPN